MDLSDYAIDTIITVMVIAVGAGLVGAHFATGGVLEAFASNWQMILTALFAALSIGAIYVIKKLKG